MPGIIQFEGQVPGDFNAPDTWSWIESASGLKNKYIGTTVLEIPMNFTCWPTLFTTKP